MEIQGSLSIVCVAQRDVAATAVVKVAVDGCAVDGCD